MPLKIDKAGKVLVSEADIERTCTELLELDGWRTIKTDLKYLRGLGVQEKGMADRLYLRYLYDPRFIDYRAKCQCGMVEGCACSQTLWIEWKSSKGKAATHQKAWHEAERRRGALVLVAGEDFPASIEGFTAWYRNSGLNRGKV